MADWARDVMGGAVMGGAVMRGAVMRSLFLLALCVQLAAAAPPKKPLVKTKPTLTAFTKPAFEDYVRHLFVWPTNIQVEIGDPKPSPMAGFSEVHVRASQGKASQDEVFYISKDGQKIIRGQIFDIAKNPFQDDLNKLRTDLRPSMGTTGASVVIAEFSDFQCPFCRDEAKALRENLLKEYPKDVRLYFMDNPLESIHPWAKPAALMGQSIFKLKPDAFWDYHDWVYEHQAEINADNFENKAFEFARSKGIDVLQLKSMLGSKAMEQEVERTLAMGRDLNVQSTPTLFVNGRKIAGAVDWRELKRIIDYEIEYQKTAKNAGEDCGCEIKLSLPGMK